MPATDIGQGVIAGGWGYVWVVYGVTWLVLSGYLVSLILRLRSEALQASGPPSSAERK